MRKKLLCLFILLCSVFSLFGVALAKDPLPKVESNPALQGKAEVQNQQTLAGVKQGKEECKGIKLNTDFPLIGRCIQIKRGGSGEGISPTEAFPTMVAALTKIVMSVILVVCLIMIIIGGIMIASDNKLGKGKELIKKVAIVILLLGFSSLILKLVNPNFFG